jgi:uncharacterized protein YjdB
VRNDTESKLSRIGEEAFQECSLLPGTQFLENLPNLLVIEDRAFYMCSYAAQINGPDEKIIELKDIYGNDYHEGYFKTVVLPSGIEELGESVFSECRNIEIIDIENANRLKTLPKNSFYHCEALQSVRLPRNLESIETSVFEGCVNLKSVEFPEESLLEIKDSVFKDCGSYRLTSNGDPYAANSNSVFYILWMDVPASYLAKDRISEDAYYLEAYGLYQKQFNEYTYTQTEQVFIKLSGLDRYAGRSEVLETLSTISYHPVEDTRSEIPEGHIRLGVPMLKGVDNQSGLVIPEDLPGDLEKCSKTLSLDNIGNDLTTGEATALNNYPSVGNVFTGLEEITIPDSVTQMGTGVFENCVNLKSVTLSNGLTEIPNRTFRGCGTRLRLMNASGSNGSGNGNGLNNDKATKNIVDRFAYSGLEQVEFPDKLESIGNNAFDGCYAFGLKDGRLPRTVASIGDYAFAGCASLSKFVAPEELISIGNYAFYKTVTMDTEETKDSIASPDPGFIYPTENTGLTEIEFDSATHLTTLGTSAFAFTNITNANFTPTQLKSVPANVFEGCKQLRTFFAGKSVENVASKAFADNMNLSNVTIPMTAVLHQDMFSGYTSRTVGILYSTDYERDIEIVVGSKYEIPVYTVNQNNTNVEGLEVFETDEEGRTVALASGILNISEQKIKTPAMFGQNVMVRDIEGMKVTDPDKPIRIRVRSNIGYDSTYYGIHFQTVQCEFNIRVIERPCESIEFTNENEYIPITDKKGITLSPEILPEDTSDRFSWEAAPENIVEMMEDGKTAAFVPLALGTAKVTLTAGNVSDSCNIHVVAPVNSISLSKETANLLMGEAGKDTDQIIADMRYASGYDGIQYPDAVAFSSSDEKIVTVDDQGNIKAQSVGTADITVTAIGSKKTAKCKVNVYSPEDLPEATKISRIDGPDVVYLGGVSAQYQAVLDPEFARNLVTFSLSRPEQSSILQITPDGVATAIKSGRVTIKAETDNGKSLTRAVRVAVLNPIEKIALVKELTLNVGGRKRLTPTLTPSNSTERLTWKSSNDKIARVSAIGEVTAVNKGNCKITVTSSSGKSAVCSVIVKKPANSIRIKANKANFKKIFIAKGQTLTLHQTITPSDSTDIITWSSSKKKIASVDAKSGVVKANKKGKTVITVKTTSGKKAVIKVNVLKKPINAKRITIKKKKRIKRNKVIRITPKLKSKKSTDAISWSCANSAIATVDEYGYITGKKKGKVKITVTTSSGKKAVCKVTVK